MQLGARTRRQMRTVGWITLFGAGVGFLVGLVRTMAGLSVSPLPGTVIGLTVSLVTGALEVMVLTSALKKRSFFSAILIKAVAHAAVILPTCSLLLWLFLDDGSLARQGPYLFMVLAISGPATLVGAFVRAMNRLLGRRVLLNFLTGRYHRPVEEERIFMFLDLVSSTTIAEKIGHRRFHALLRDFFFDITEPIVAAKGEIYKYVGDEVIVVWERAMGLPHARCLRCCLELQQLMAQRHGAYLQEYGVAPSFRIGMHAGTVVAGEIGDDRQEIAFLGDVVNTAARILAECRPLQRDLLVSGDLLELVGPVAGLQAERVGAVKLRGKDRAVELHGISFEAPAGSQP